MSFIVAGFGGAGGSLFESAPSRGGQQLAAVILLLLLSAAATTATTMLLLLLLLLLLRHTLFELCLCGHEPFMLQPQQCIVVQLLALDLCRDTHRSRTRQTVTQRKTRAVSILSTSCRQRQIQAGSDTEGASKTQAVSTQNTQALV